MKYFLTYEQAEELLPEGETVHTFYNNGPILAGADWGRDEIIDKLKKSDHIELTGESARGMGHGMCAYNEGATLSDVLFIETDEKKVAALEKEVEAEKEEIKPCPFCGAPAQIVELSGRYAVECTKHCASTRIFKDKETPTEAWNRRVQNATI